MTSPKKVPSLLDTKPAAAPGSVCTDKSTLNNRSVAADYKARVKKALRDPNKLSKTELTALGRAVCDRAADGIQNAKPAADICVFMILEERGEQFVDSFLVACHNLFNEQDSRLRQPNASEESRRRWIAYVRFLAELLLRLRDCCEQVGGFAGSRHAALSAAKHRLRVTGLLCDCCHTILRPPSLGNAAEVECLRSVLTMAGKAIESGSQRLMQTLEWRLRDACMQPGLPSEARKTLVELIELRASGWKLNLAQQLYLATKDDPEPRY